MHQKNRSGIINSSLLLHRKNIIHGYSTKIFGDMTDSRNRKNFFKVQKISGRPVVSQNQTHGDKVEIITPDITNDTVVNADATIYRAHKFDPGKPVLTVYTADCVGMILVDYSSLVVGVCHAGWKGTLSHIAGKVVNKMHQIGAKLDHILISIGPSIGKCCYDVNPERAALFIREYPGNNQVVIKRGGRFYINLASANLLDLIKSGIMKKNIDLSHLCTSCGSKDFFSYRRDGNSNSGEMIGFVTVNI